MIQKENDERLEPAAKPKSLISYFRMTRLELAVVAVVLATLVWLLQPALGPVRGYDGKIHHTRMSLKQIGFALHDYETEYLVYPDTAIRDEQGNPLLSWRVRLLPYLEQEELYRQFKLDEPWDSEHNKKLIPQIPPVFKSPYLNEETYKTNLLLPVSVGVPETQSTMFPEGRGLKEEQILDGNSDTIMLVTVADDLNVIWTKPGDLPFNPEDPGKGLQLGELSYSMVLMADGSVSIVPKEMSPEKVLSLFTCAGNDHVAEKSAGK